MKWRILQLADSAFPVGTFAHSAGLEAAYHQGYVKDAVGLERFVRHALWQAGYGALPLANEGFGNPKRLAELDALNDVFLINHVANQASRIQGRTYLSTCANSFAGIAPLRQKAKRQAIRFHFAPLFGTSLRLLALEKQAMQEILLFGVLRSTVSAAVRLGIVGPYQAQRIQDGLGPVLDQILDECGALEGKDLAQTSPVIDLLQTNHDRLYSRLFQS